MIDIHSHILPGLDDGAQDLQQSVELARMAVKEGIHTVIATPHHANMLYYNEAQKVVRSVRKLKNVLREMNIPLEILSGQEVRVYAQMIEDAYEGLLMPLNGSNYILIEFPSNQIPPHFDELLKEFRSLCLTPVIAHPERNQQISENPQILYEFIKKGALSQVTSHSLYGYFGKRVQSLALSLCRNHLVHFVASDAHHHQGQAFHLLEAFDVIEAELGYSYKQYFMNNAQAIVENKPIQKWEPRVPQWKWYQFWKQKVRS